MTSYCSDHKNLLTKYIEIPRPKTQVSSSFSFVINDFSVVQFLFCSTLLPQRHSSSSQNRHFWSVCINFFWCANIPHHYHTIFFLPLTLFCASSTTVRILSLFRNASSLPQLRLLLLPGHSSTLFYITVILQSLLSLTSVSHLHDFRHYVCEILLKLQRFFLEFPQSFLFFFPSQFSNNSFTLFVKHALSQFSTFFSQFLLSFISFTPKIPLPFKIYYSMTLFCNIHYIILVRLCLQKLEKTSLHTAVNYNL